MSSLPHRSQGACARLAASAALSACLISSAAAQTAPADGPTELEEISVTANRVEGPPAAIGSAVSSISGEELEQRQIRVVSDVLRELPGVAVNRTGPVGALTQIRIRGSEGNQTLVLVDGVRMNDPGTSAEFDFANLLNLEVERVDVLRGPQSALYGSDAIGGVINIVTRKGEPGPTRFRASIEGGSFNTATGTASVSGGTAAYDYLIAGQGFSTRGVSTATRFDAYAPTSSLDRDRYRSGTGLAKVSVRPTENLEFSGVARYTEFDADRDGFGAASDGYPFAASVDNRDTETGKQFFGRAQAKATLLDGAWDHVLGLSYTNQDRRSFDGTGLKTYASLGEMTRFDYQTNLRFRTEGALPASHVLTFGADHTRDAVKSFTAFPYPEDAANPLRRHIDDAGLVGQYQIGFFEKLFVTGSVRQDFNDRFKEATTYRLASAYTFDQTGTKLRASWGTGVKNPTTFELFGFSGNYIPNGDLKPERGEGWDAGFDQPLWSDRVVFDATYFQQRVRDLISSETVADPGDPTGFVNRPINLAGTTRIDGVEVGLTVRPLDGLTLRGAYTFTDGEDATGATLVRRPRHVASFNANYAFLEGKANVNLGVVYNGRQRDFAYDAKTYARTSAPLKAYTLVNLAGSYKVHENAEVYGRIENLFDRKYEEVLTYNTPGRAAYGGVKVSF
ncbi:TonB-dependent receptor plug domain-containing protein [Hansschlegelia plantiphila]|uniref:TonB-dependent receptor n=1 Tax=Hansschlegelia plantiphila TaxID=374655 RepID=A0A9W6IY08_9HYPH|nr:TonB-dependent receptor [Hansschlegelia plantiphila]GLK66787.1 TonB-dependent receptor [Hansschlegelia plantiphila]